MAASVEKKTWRYILTKLVMREKLMVIVQGEQKEVLNMQNRWQFKLKGELKAYDYIKF